MKNEMKDTVAKRLLELRGTKSREEVATAVQVSVSALQMYENAQRIPKDEIKIRIAAYYKKSVQEIFFDHQTHVKCGSKKTRKKEVG